MQLLRTFRTFRSEAMATCLDGRESVMSEYEHECEALDLTEDELERAALAAKDTPKGTGNVLVAIEAEFEKNEEDGARKAWFFRLKSQVNPTLDDLCLAYVLSALQANMGNKTLTAKKLGIDRRTLHRHLERMGYRG